MTRKGQLVWSCHNVTQPYKLTQPPLDFPLPWCATFTARA